MSKFPYTSSQIVRAYDAACERVSGFDVDDIKEILHGLLDNGITVTFPEPRYYVGDEDGAYGNCWHVWDRESNDRCVAEFHTKLHPDARCAAQAECERLNNPPRFVTGRDLL